MKNTTSQSALLLYKELSDAHIRAAQRRLKAGELQRIAPGVLTSLAPSEWPALIRRERIRVLAALFPGAVMGYLSAFDGGVPTAEGIVYLSHGYARKLSLPGLTVQLLKGPGACPGDAPMMGRELYFPSPARLLLENLTPSRGKVHKSAGTTRVEQRLIAICEARGEEELKRLRDDARQRAPQLGLERECQILDGLIATILGSRKSPMATAAGKALAADVPYDARRLALFEQLAAALRSSPLRQPGNALRSPAARMNFAFLESYFSNFIEGTEFDIDEARAFVLEGKPITVRPQDSHDVMGVFRQAHEPGWAHQTLSPGEAVLQQLRVRHADQMQARPEVNPGGFKAVANRAGNTEFVAPRLVRGTLIEGARLLPSVPAGTARALFAMFLVTEVHPFADGNGRLARLVMNAELSAMDSCRIIVPTLFRDEYLDCLRLLSREGTPEPFLDAMQAIHGWTAAFAYDDIDAVITLMKACNALEKSRVQFKLLNPSQLDRALAPGTPPSSG